MEIANIGDVLEKCKKGDKAAWNMIIQNYSKTVFNIAYNFIGDRDLAADITQDVFCRIYSNIEKFKDDRNFGAWIYVIAKNYCIDYWRKNKKHIAFEFADDSFGSDKNSPEELTIRKSEIEFLRNQLMKLEPEMRLFLILRDVLHLSYQQIAERFNLPDGTVKSRINRARTKLSEMYHCGEKKHGMQKG